MTDEHRPLRRARIGQDRVDGRRVEAFGETIVEPDANPDRRADDLGGPSGADLGRADDRVRLEPDLGEERAESLGLELALLAQRSRCVIALECLGVAGVGVTQEVELEVRAAVGRAHSGSVARNASIRSRRSARVAR